MSVCDSLWLVTVGVGSQSHCWGFVVRLSWFCLLFWNFSTVLKMLNILLFKEENQTIENVSFTKWAVDYSACLWSLKVILSVLQFSVSMWLKTVTLWNQLSSNLPLKSNMIHDCGGFLLSFYPQTVTLNWSSDSWELPAQLTVNTPVTNSGKTILKG